MPGGCPYLPLKWHICMMYTADCGIVDIYKKCCLNYWKMLLTFVSKQSEGIP